MSLPHFHNTDQKQNTENRWFRITSHECFWRRWRRPSSLEISHQGQETRDEGQCPRRKERQQAATVENAPGHRPHAALGFPERPRWRTYLRVSSGAQLGCRLSTRAVRTAVRDREVVKTGALVLRNNFDSGGDFERSSIAASTRGSVEGWLVPILFPALPLCQCTINCRWIFCRPR